MLTTDGRIQAVGNMDNTTPVIDIPIGTLVQFGDKFVTIQPENFVDGTLNARQLTSGINNTNNLFDGMGEQFGLENSQNTIRVNAPTTTRYLYLNRDGSLYFTDNPTGSNANECLLLRSEYKGSSNPPELRNYINLRNAVVTKTGVATTDADSKQFINDVGIPPGIGYTKAYGVKASGKELYELTLSGISAIDDVVTVGDVTTGDKWVVEMHIFSIY